VMELFGSSFVVFSSGFGPFDDWNISIVSIGRDTAVVLRYSVLYTKSQMFASVFLSRINLMVGLPLHRLSSRLTRFPQRVSVSISDK
jgi:hypothetical protein